MLSTTGSMALRLEDPRTLPLFVEWAVHPTLLVVARTSEERILIVGALPGTS
jgi:hypothetical protein